MSKDSDKYGTPMELFEWLDQRFHFITDPCTEHDNRLGCPIYYTEEDDGLAQEWIGPVFMNPPYSKVAPWMEKAYGTTLLGHLVVALVRHDPSTQWWQNWVEGKALVVPVPYRIKFHGGDGLYNFPSVILIYMGQLRFSRPGHE